MAAAPGVSTNEIGSLIFAGVVRDWPKFSDQKYRPPVWSAVTAWQAASNQFT
jgi:hypothetical protein